MKLKAIALIFAAVLAALSFTGCVSNAPQIKVTPEQGAAAVRVAVSTGATLALANNPKEVPVAQALVAGIDVAVAANTTVTPEGIRSFVTDICAQYNVPANRVPLYVALSLNAYNAYTTAYKTQVVSATDPTVLLYVTAFKNGLNDALLAVAPPKST